MTVSDENPLHNQDLLKEIFVFSGYTSFAKICLVSKKWSQSIYETSLFKDLILKKIAVTPQDWEQDHHLISADEVEEAFKLLPKNLDEILKRPSIAFPEKRILETHKLVWIPKELQNKALTFNLFKTFFMKKSYVTHPIINQEGNKPIKCGWVLIANEVLKASLNKNCSVNRVFLENYNKDHQTAWEVPAFGHAVICLTMIYRKFGECLVKNPCYTWCQEDVDQLQIAIKCEPSSSIHISSYRSYYDFIGVAPLWRI